MSYTIPNIITWAKYSQPLARLDAIKKKAFTGGGGNIDDKLDIKIYLTRKSVEFEYAQDTTSSNLFELGNYLYALCFTYVLAAQEATGGGGSISPITPRADYIYAQLSLTVGGGSGHPVNGAGTYQNDDLIGAMDLNFFIVGNTTYSVGSDYTFNSTTGTITLVTNTWFTGDAVIIPFNKKIA